MKILLIGEYSNLHNSLKQGLQKNGFEVTLLSTGDGFKNFDSDIAIKSSLFENKFLNSDFKKIIPCYSDSTYSIFNLQDF